MGRHGLQEANIIKVLRKHGSGTPKQIKQWLKEGGYTQELLFDSMLHEQLKRLIARERIRQVKYRLHAGEREVVEYALTGRRYYQEALKKPFTELSQKGAIELTKGYPWRAPTFVLGSSVQGQDDAVQRFAADLRRELRVILNVNRCFSCR